MSEGFKDLEEPKEDEQDEAEKLVYLQKQEEYKTIFLEIREKVKALLQEASELVGRIHFHRASISELAASIDLRYKDLARHMKQYHDTLKTKLACSVPEFEVTFYHNLFLSLKVTRKHISFSFFITLFMHIFYFYSTGEM